MITAIDAPAVISSYRWVWLPREDEHAERAEPDEAGDRGGGDHLVGRRADAGDDQRQGVGHLDLPQRLQAGEPHAAGRVADVGGHAVDAGRGVQHDRRDREHDQRDEHRPQRERPPPEQQGDDADRRDRPPQPGEVGGDEAPATGVPDGQPDRQAECERPEQGQERVPEVLAEAD